MKPVLKAPGTMLLKLRYDEPLSNFAFNFNLRRYISAGDRSGTGRSAWATTGGGARFGSGGGGGGSRGLDFWKKRDSGGGRGGGGAGGAGAGSRNEGKAGQILLANATSSSTYQTLVS